jgi:hypothetical protein
VDIVAEVAGFESESMMLYYTDDDSTWEKVTMDITVEQEQFAYTMFDMQRATKYYVKAANELSDIYRLTVYEPPMIKRVNIRYKYPRYTKLKPKTERDGGDVWALQGTVVTLVAVADKPLSSAEVVIAGDRLLKTSVVNDTVVTASFTVTQDSYYTVRITDKDGLDNVAPPEFYIHALHDELPLLTIDRPGRDLKASMLEEVPVEMTLQDDYSVPAVSLFYTLNGTTEKQVDLKVREIASREPAAESHYSRTYKTDHMFYFEDLRVMPGDFLSYYVKAGDERGDEKTEWVTSDIFFIEVRPFEMEFFRPLSQGNTGGGSGGSGTELSASQKDILVATWKLQQNRDKLDPSLFSENVESIAESQQNISEVTRSMLFQMQQRYALDGLCGSCRGDGEGSGGIAGAASTGSTGAGTAGAAKALACGSQGQGAPDATVARRWRW